MSPKKRILLKITGEIFFDSNKNLSATIITNLIHQVKKLSDSYHFGIVVGGGNFFRGNQHGKAMGIGTSVGHEIGMLATMMNGLMLKDLFEKHDLPAALFCAMPCPEIGKPISQQTINEAIHGGRILIFTGGTGNPFFTTDTNAVLRALQIEADEVWKGTNVDGVYNADPRKHPDSIILKNLTLIDAIQQRLGVMDLTAYAMAEQHNQKIRVFNIFASDALLRAAQDPNFGTLIA